MRHVLEAQPTAYAQFATYAEAVNSLPQDAEWSSSFGLTTHERGCVVYFRKGTTRWMISNAPYNNGGIAAWSVCLA